MADRSVPAPAVGLLTLALVWLPWAAGGRSPLGRLALVLALSLAGVLAAWCAPEALPRRAALVAGLLGLPVALSTWQGIYPDRGVQAILELVAYVTGGVLAAGIARMAPWGAGLLLGTAALSGALVAGIGAVRWWQAADSGLYAGVLTGPFGYPNAAAGFLLLTGGLALAAALSLTHPTARLVAGLGTIGILTAIALTRSRGAALALAVGLAAGGGVALRGYRPWRRLLPWVLLVGLGVAVGIAGTPLGPWLAARFDPADSSFAWRRQMLSMAWEMVRDRPWLGVGPGGFPVAANLYQRLPYVGGQNPHNILLEWAAEFGLPAALLGCAGVAAILARALRTRPPLPAADRQRLPVLVGTLAAFASHAAVDIDWSYPAIALLAAVTVGLVAAVPDPLRSRPSPRRGGAGLILAGLLVGAALLAGGRFGAGLLVARADERAQRGDLSGAQADLVWALRLNPMSFSGHQLLARIALQQGNPPGALQTAMAIASLNPDDPNSLALAGEVAGAAGRWSEAEDWYRRAVALAPAAQLRLHVGLVEAALLADHAAEAQLAYARLLDRFPPGRVLAEDARCLAPGDRYLLARVARRLLPPAKEGAGPIPPEELQEAADRLGKPDSRPICGSRGRPGQTSPEAAVQTFWEAWRSGERPAADRLVAAPLAGRPHLLEGPQPPADVRMVAIQQLDAGEDQALLRYILQGELPDGRAAEWCAATHLHRKSVGWIIDRPTALLSPCDR